MANTKRFLEEPIRSSLDQSGIVLLEGADGVGKSTLGRKVCSTFFDFDDPSPKTLAALDANPDILLKGKGPRFLDNGYVFPRLVQTAKERGGSFLFSSATLSEEPRRFVLRPLSLSESGESSDEVSISGLFSGAYATSIKGEAKLDYEGLAQAIYRGGWPKSLGRSMSTCPREILDDLIQRKISEFGSIDQNPDRFSAILTMYAAHLGSIDKNTDLLKELRVNDPLIAESSLYDVLGALRKLHILDEVEAWHPNIKAQVAIRKLPYKQFVDPSLACYLLGIKGKDLQKDYALFGKLFQSLCYRDFRVYASALNGQLLRYEDRVGLQADAILRKQNGAYALVQFRMGKEDGLSAAKQLVALRKKILVHDAKHPEEMIGLPSFLLVVSAIGKAYRNEEGVYFAPISTLTL